MKLFLKEINNENPQVFVIKSDAFEKTNLANCYDKYGQEIGHYDAGDYSIHNSSCDLYQECLLELNKNFNTDFDSLEDCNLNVEQKQFIDGFEEQKSHYETVKAHNFWNGNNYSSIIIEADNQDEAKTHEVFSDKEEIKKYKKALKKALKKQGNESFGITTYSTKYSEIIKSRFANDPFNYTIILKNE